MADSRDMYLVHSAFRREFPAAAALVRTVAANDSATAARVADHVLILTGLLNLHHAGEDEKVWPKLLQRGPKEIAPLVETMERQHEGLHEALAEVERRATAWRRTATAVDRDALASAVDAMIAPMLEHLVTEETHLLALIDKYLTDKEWAEVGAAAMATVPKNLLPMAFGMVLRDGTPEHVAGLKAVIPGPAWFVLSRFGPGAYTRYARRLGLDRVRGAV
ncbi:hemerythrin domain-containing protein [Micromonospora sp. NPDC049230]|uniref:hemerythrin domain-containing protein n=1 Tax=Micromonospora sp. NPDC049230 TaxID=3155502 RepID=UPI0033EFFABE